MTMGSLKTVNNQRCSLRGKPLSENCKGFLKHLHQGRNYSMLANQSRLSNTRFSYTDKVVKSTRMTLWRCCLICWLRLKLNICWHIRITLKLFISRHRMEIRFKFLKLICSLRWPGLKILKCQAVLKLKSLN